MSEQDEDADRLPLLREQVRDAAKAYRLAVEEYLAEHVRQIKGDSLLSLTEWESRKEAFKVTPIIASEGDDHPPTVRTTSFNERGEQIVETIVPVPVSDTEDRIELPDWFEQVFEGATPFLCLTEEQIEKLVEDGKYFWLTPKPTKEVGRG